MKYSVISILTALALTLVACSGASEDLVDGFTPNEDEDFAVTEVTVSMPKTVGSSSSADYDSEHEEESYSTTAFKEGKSKLFISQLGTSGIPNFTPKSNSDDDRLGKGAENLYVYTYYNNPDADWKDGYNFKADNNKPITWSAVKEKGSVGNSFVFYAFNYPDDMLPLDANNATMANNAMQIYQWQNKTGVRDFLGAYHTTSSLYSRLRFRLHHLLVYLKVTLYVPEYEVTNDETGYTGFNQYAFTGASSDADMAQLGRTVKITGTKAEYADRDYQPGIFVGADSNGGSLTLSFNIDWRANRSSDYEAPVAQLITNSSTPGYKTGTPFMYPHPAAAEDRQENEEDAGPKIIEEFDVQKFYKPAKPDKYYKAKDRVRKYEFSATFPAQASVSNSSTRMLTIRLRTPGSDLVNGSESKESYKTFYFYPSQIMSGSELQLTQGTMQHISLYVPRTGNNTILVGAEVLPWEESSVDMAITPDDDEPDEISNK